MELLRLGVGHLDPTTIQRYSTLTPKEFQCCLQGKNPYGIDPVEIYALSLEDAGELNGLLLASYYPFLRITELHIVYSNNHQFEKQLLDRLIQGIQLKGCTYIYTFVKEQQENASKKQLIFDEAGWSTPQLVVIRYYFDVQSFNPPWLKESFLLPYRYKVTSWKRISEKERIQIQNLVKQRGVADHLDPFVHEEKIELTNSLCVRYDKQVIGWMIAHRLEPDLVSFAKLYILPEHRTRGVAVKMLIKSIQHIKKSTVTRVVMETNMEYEEGNWLLFVKKRLGLFALSTEKIYQRGLKL